MAKHLAALVAAVILAVVPAVAAEDPAGTPVFPKELDQYIVDSLKRADLPGAAIAIVKDGRIVIVKGYGVRALGKPEAVDGDTIFDIASITKSFTAAAIATLVDEKKMSWDEPVRHYLPRLELSDAYVSDHLTMRDLLSHRTGIRPMNSTWYFTRRTRSQVVAAVRNFEFAAPFRTKSVYSNIGYTIAGEVAAEVGGTSWEELVTHRLLEPLHMTRSTAVFADVPSLGNFASGHGVIDGVQQVIPRETTRQSTAPAGAVQTSVRDLATWALFQLGDGSYLGRRILSGDAMTEMHSPQVLFQTTEAFRTARQVRFFAAYGFGWQVFDYRGNRMLWHSGGGDGQAAYLALLPESNLGVAVLINSSKIGSTFNLALASRIVDHYLGVPTRDYASEAFEGWKKRQQRDADEQRAIDAARRPDTLPSLPLDRYAGVFRDPIGLDIVITRVGDELRLQYAGGEIATLTHWHHDTFRAQWENPWHRADLSCFVSFAIDAKGVVDRLHMEPFGDPHDARRVQEVP